MTDLRRDGAPWTMRNRLFETDVSNGHPHRSASRTYSDERGCVFDGPLYEADDGGTLWLEHVLDRNTGTRAGYWLMWYKPDGYPITVASSVLGRDQVAEIARRLSTLLP